MKVKISQLVFTDCKTLPRSLWLYWCRHGFTQLGAGASEQEPWKSRQGEEAPHKCLGREKERGDLDFGWSGLFTRRSLLVLPLWNPGVPECRGGSLSQHHPYSLDSFLPEGAGALGSYPGWSLKTWPSFFSHLPQCTSHRHPQCPFLMLMSLPTH